MSRRLVPERERCFESAAGSSGDSVPEADGSLSGSEDMEAGGVCVRASVCESARERVLCPREVRPSEGSGRARCETKYERWMRRTHTSKQASKQDNEQGTHSAARSTHKHEKRKNEKTARTRAISTNTAARRNPSHPTWRPASRRDPRVPLLELLDGPAYISWRALERQAPAKCAERERERTQIQFKLKRCCR